MKQLSSHGGGWHRYNEVLMAEKLYSGGRKQHGYELLTPVLRDQITLSGRAHLRHMPTEISDPEALPSLWFCMDSSRT